MGLALWSLGMIVVRSRSLSAVADWWACRLGQDFNTVRERLRDTYRAAEAKAGVSQAEMCQLDGLRRPAQLDHLVAPVELAGLAGREGQWHEGLGHAGAAGGGGLPLLHKALHRPS